MENNSKLNKGYIIGIIAAVVILIIIGIFVDGRNKGTPMDMNAQSSATTTMSDEASSTPASSTPATTTTPVIPLIVPVSAPLTSQNDAVLVVAPNGGEMWNAGSFQTISWKIWERYLSYNMYDIVMVPQKGNCIYPMPCATNLSPVTIATGIATTSYQWQVGSAANLGTGSYKAEVCFAGTKICDMSDSPFTITATATSSPTCPSTYSWNGSKCAFVSPPIQPI